MSTLMNSLGIDRLAPAERLQLVDEILDSFDRESQPLTDAQKTELDRRIALLEANPDSVSTWEEVEARVLARLRQ